MSASLFPQEVQLFRHNGFVKLPTQFSLEKVRALKTVISQNIDQAIETVVRQNDRIIRISNLWSRGRVFRESIASNEILDPLEKLLGSNIEFVLNRHNHVYLRDRSSTHSLEPHRDVMHWSRTIVTVLVYLEDTSVENGCTHVVPGSHHLPDLLNFADQEHLHKIVREQCIPVPMLAGEMLAIDSMIIHSAGRNQTNGTRMSMTLGYHSVDELLPVDNSKRFLVRGQRIYRGNDIN